MVVYIQLNQKEDWYGLDTVKGVTVNDQPPGFVFIHTGLEPVGEEESKDTYHRKRREVRHEIFDDRRTFKKALSDQQF